MYLSLPGCVGSTSRLSRLTTEDSADLSFQHLGRVLGQRLRVAGYLGQPVAQLAWYGGRDLLLGFRAEVGGHLPNVQLQDGLQLGGKRTGLRRATSQGGDDD